MTRSLELYRCSVCDTVVEMLQPCGVELTCCGRAMEEMVEKFHQFGRERHCPMVERTTSGVRVSVGPLPHPMTEKHFIEWIELITDDGSYRRFLAPGQKPEVEFDVQPEHLYVRAFCTAHGLWTSRQATMLCDRRLLMASRDAREQIRAVC